VSESLPKGNQGCLIRRIDDGLGTIERFEEKEQKRERKERIGIRQPRRNQNDVITNRTSCSIKHIITMTTTTSCCSDPDP